MDVVVTVPICFKHPAHPGLRGLDAWIAEGDAVGDEWTGVLWDFTCFGSKPDIQTGENVYVVCEGRLRGYAPLVKLRFEKGRITFVRAGGAVAITILGKIRGFRGWRYRWWSRSEEIPFPDWKGSPDA